MSSAEDRDEEKNLLIRIKDNKLRDFISGFIAGLISVTVCNPLDITRTRLNIMSSPHHNSNRYVGFSHALKVIWREEGVRGFFSGYLVNIKAIPIFHSLFFTIYQSMKKLCRDMNMPHWKQYVISTTVAGSICNLITNPIWVIRTRIMVQILHHSDLHYKSNSIWKITKQIIQQEGVKSLFRGLSASLLGISNAIIYFFMYENFRRLIRQRNLQFNSYYVGLSSIVSKLVSSSITYPLILIRTIMHDHRTQQQMSFQRICKYVYNQRGISGFYGGLKPDLIRLIPSNTIVFLVYEYMKRVL